MNAEEKYGNLLYTGPPDDPAIFRSHPKMPLQDRAKIFSPFAALRGHGDKILDENDKLLRVKRTPLSEDDAAILSDKLLQVKKGTEVAVKYFMPDEMEPELGNYIELTGKVTEINPVYRFLKIEGQADDDGSKKIDTLIMFDDLADINSKAFVDIDEYPGIDDFNWNEMD